MVDRLSIKHEHRKLRKVHRLATICIAASGLICPAEAQVRERTGAFAEAEGTIRNPAQCRQIADAIRDVPTPGGLARIDFGAIGPLTLVHFDGTLAYMGICTEPDAKVLCITYSTNDMKVGEVVVVSGSY
jgi:hypothetical protein